MIQLVRWRSSASMGTEVASEMSSPTPVQTPAAARVTMNEGSSSRTWTIPLITPTPNPTTTPNTKAR